MLASLDAILGINLFLNVIIYSMNEALCVLEKKGYRFVYLWYYKMDVRYFGDLFIICINKNSCVRENYECLNDFFKGSFLRKKSPPSI